MCVLCGGGHRGLRSGERVERGGNGLRFNRVTVLKCQLGLYRSQRDAQADQSIDKLERAGSAGDLHIARSFLLRAVMHTYYVVPV